MEETLMEEMKKNIDENEIISFDIFDTLIFRNTLEPADIFKNVSISSGHIRFYQIRLLSGKLAQKICKKELKIDDIYKFVSIFYRKKISKKLCECEIQEEIRCSYFNYDFEEILKYCKEKNKMIILISDMYLPLSAIEKIVAKIPFEFNEKNINVSCEMGCSKRNGTLFKEVSKKYGVQYNKILHIGDNVVSDYRIPKIIGINTVRYIGGVTKSKIVDKTKRNNLYYRQLCGFIKKYESSNFDEYEKIGYETLGPLLAGYCWFLEEKAKKNKNIVFLSRDGLIIKKSFEKLFSNYNLKYLYGSRRSLINPTFGLCNNEDELLDAAYIPYQVTGEKLLGIFNVDAVDKANKIVGHYGINNKKVKTSNLKRKGQYFNLMLDLYPIILEKSNKIRSELFKYLDIVIESNYFLLVDIGWNGNMQKALQRYCINRFGCCEIKGVYVGLNPFTRSDKIDYCGYIDDKKNYKAIKSYISLFEFFFSNHEGSVVGYSGGNPICEPPEYQIDDNEYRILDKIQGAALRFIDDLTIYKNFYDFYRDKSVCFANINYLGMQPSLEQVELFADVRFKDNIVKKMIYSNKKENLKSFIVGYKDSLWRVGFLKKRFKLKFNYYKLNFFLRKIFIRGKNDY